MTAPRRAEEDVGQTRWESVVDKAIAEAQRRGDFDDLPGAGQPLRIEDYPFAGDQAMAFHALKSAGVVPYWMELGREVEDELAALAETRERTARSLKDRLAEARASVGAPDDDATVGGSGAGAGARGRWPFRGRRSPGRRARPLSSRSSVSELEAERQRARQRYLERAAALDSKIGAYNAALPDDLWRLRRGHVGPNDAAREFDAVCPPITTEAGGGF